MRKLLLASLLFAATAFGAKTTVQDTLYRADGSTCAGTISLYWPSFTSSDGHLNVAGTFTSQVRNGLLSVSVEPGNYYTVIYRLVPAGCAPAQEYWNVPVSATPVNLAAVRSLAVPVTPPLISLSSLAQSGATNGQCILWSSMAVSWIPGSCGSGGGTSIGGAVTSGTTGSILFVNPSAILAQDNANFNWDPANHCLNIGLTTTGCTAASILNASVMISKPYAALGLVSTGAGNNAELYFHGFGSPGTTWVFGAQPNGNFSFYDATHAANALVFEPNGPNFQLYGHANGAITVGSASADTGFARNAAGVMELNNGTPGTYRDWKFRNLTLTGLAGSGTKCIHSDNSGVVSLAAADCGSGSGGNDTHAISTSTTPVFDRLAANQSWSFTISTSNSAATTSGLTAGDFLVFNITQCATVGGCNFTWPTGFSEACTIANGNAFTGVANLGIKQEFYWDGSAAHAVTPCVTTASPIGTGISRSDTPNFSELSGDVTTSGSNATTIASHAVNSAKMAIVNTRRVCDIAIGDTSASALTSSQLGPQKRICYIPAASTIVEMDVSADAGTPNIIVGKNTAGSVLNIVSSALATAASGGIACSNTGGTTGIDGVTTCSSTLQNTALAAGSYLELVSGTAGGVANFMTVHVIYTVN